MSYLLRKLSETSLASFFWIHSCLRHLSSSQTSLALSFPLHFSVLPLSRNIVSLLIASLLSSRCASRGTYIGKCLVVRLLSHKMAFDPLPQFVEDRGPHLFRRGKDIDRGKRKRHTEFSLCSHFLSVSQRELWRTMETIRKDQSIKRSYRANLGKIDSITPQ
jgi:hypothetical protein